MYCPPSFREDRLEVLHALVRAHPLATLVTAGEDGLRANLIPFTLADEGDKGVLRAHLARANDQLPALRAGAQTLVIFRGPQSYVTPSWYPTKAQTHKVVPTWNYVVVQATGRPRVIEDRAWLRTQIEALTAAQEASRTLPWKVSEAPDDFIAAQLAAVVGVEIPIDHLEGKWKVSQNRAPAEREGVADGLAREGGCEAMRRLVARGGA